MSIGTIILILLLVALLGGAGAYGSRTWGLYYGSGISLTGVILLLIALRVFGII